MDEIDEVLESDPAKAKSFDERRRAKWQRGRGERGLFPGEPFDGDAAEEMQEELLDLVNYAEQAYVEGRISEEAFAHAREVSIQLDEWARSIPPIGGE
jgi:hypothetical protein